MSIFLDRLLDKQQFSLSLVDRSVCVPLEAKHPCLTTIIMVNLLCHRRRFTADGSVDRYFSLCVVYNSTHLYNILQGSLPGRRVVERTRGEGKGEWVGEGGDRSNRHYGEWVPGVHDGITPPLGVYSPYIFAGVSPLDPVGYPLPPPFLYLYPGGVWCRARHGEKRERERKRETDLGKPRARAEHFGLAKFCREFAPSTRYHFSSGVRPVSTNMEQ